MDFLSSLMKWNLVRYDIPCSKIILKGKDSLDFLQKMTTNDVRKLNKENFISTIFVNSHGKIIDEALVFLLKEHEVLLISKNPAKNYLSEWIETFHFTEDFIAEDADNFFVSVLITRSFLPDNIVKSALLFEAEGLKVFLAVKEKPFSEPEISFDEWETLRIMGKFPSFPNEISQLYMPQNIGLGNQVALDKGCFIGQEVIAKAFTYQKNPASLFFIQTSLQNYEKLKKQPEIITKNYAGRLTSLSPCYLSEKVIGLAVMRKKQSSEEEINFLDEDIFK